MAFVVIPPLSPSPAVPAVPEVWLDALPAARRDYAYVLSVSPWPCDRFAMAGIVADCSVYDDDVARWARQDLEPGMVSLVVSSSIGRADQLREDLERLLVSQHGLFVRECMMSALCHAREDLRCIEIVLSLCGQADALTQTLVALDAWVNEHAWPASTPDEDYRLWEVATEHPDAWWGAEPPASWRADRDPAEGDEDD